MYYFLCNWIGEHEITKLKKIYLLEIQKKGDKNKHKKTGMTIWYFQQCARVNAIYFAPVVTTTYRMKHNKSSTRGLSLKISVLARARAQLLNTPSISTHLWAYHMEKISRRLFYICRNWYYLWVELSGWMGYVSYGLGADLSLPPCLSVTIGIWTLAHKSDPRAEISGEIVWYDALAPRPEVLLPWCSVCACAISLFL